MIYILKAWAHQDGETTIFCFTSAEKRQEFMNELGGDARERFDSEYWWNRWWETEDLPINPKAPIGN